MAKLQNASEELAQIESERKRLAAADKALKARAKALQKLAKGEGAKLLAASISRQKYAGVTKPLADQLAKQISALGIAASIERLK